MLICFLKIGFNFVPSFASSFAKATEGQGMIHCNR